MLTRFEGVVRNGHIELPQGVPVVEGTHVKVTLQPADQPSTKTANRLKALESLAEIRRGMPPMDVVEMVEEARKRLSARANPEAP